MTRLADAGLAGGGEGVDTGFAPDATLEDGDIVEGADWCLDVLHTPGHFAGHLSFVLGDAIFTGDHVMGWASTLISPPDGDLAAFMASCAKLSARPARIFTRATVPRSQTPAAGSTGSSTTVAPAKPRSWPPSMRVPPHLPSWPPGFTPM